MSTVSPAPRQQVSNRIILASNRLPVTIERLANGQYSLKRSSGGLVSSLNGFSSQYISKWYGWPGTDVPISSRAKLEEVFSIEYGAHPIWLDAELARKYYHVVSNLTLWPLLHSCSPSLVASHLDWKAYMEVNKLFARSIAGSYEEGDVIWVHDYHLMMLPKFLRQELAGRAKIGKIGMFLHVPFPPKDVFDQFSMKNELLQGLLESDLIGFHIDQYAQNFLQSCSFSLKPTDRPTIFSRGGELLKVNHFSIGIQPSTIIRTIDQPKTRKIVTALRRRFRGRKIILGVDRLDFIKGIPQKLETMHRFLDENPSWKSKIALVQVLVPSRDENEEALKLRSNIKSLAKRLNESFSTDGELVHLIHRSLDADELIPLYTAAHICFVSSIMDGMNLVAFEYVAAQRDNKGVLLLSQYTGASQRLQGHIPVDPLNINQTTLALQHALTINDDDRINRHRRLYAHVMRYTNTVWYQSFIQELLYPEN